ncbi:isochorismatase family protein [soil metagenome]
MNDNLKNSALIIVDMQNDFVRPGAPLEVPDAIHTVPAHKKLLEVYRSQSLPVIYTKFLSHPHYYLLWNWSPQCQPPTKCCWKGHKRYYEDVKANLDCTEIIEELAPATDDLIIEKYYYGAFHDTALATHLKSKKIETVVVTGTVTQICVEETAREAFHHGFKTIVVEDAVSSFAPDLHIASLKNFRMKFGWVMRSEAVIASIISDSEVQAPGFYF